MTTTPPFSAIDCNGHFKDTNASAQEIADVMLAQQQGWTAVAKVQGRLWGFHAMFSGIAPIPRPSLDWYFCGSLLSSCNLTIDTATVGKIKVSWLTLGGKQELVGDYTKTDEKDGTLRYLIVLAAYEQTKNAAMTAEAYAHKALHSEPV
jgi:hypothetical protein